MLGHKLWQCFLNRFDTYMTLRQGLNSYNCSNLFEPERVISHVSVENFDSVVRAIAMVRPTVIINCIGIIKQVPAAKDPLASISVNALFPHRLAQVCQAAGIRLIHFSTDCVFSGRQGNYTEAEIPDPEDLYGRTKLLGEVTVPGCLTLRTSIIGRELQSRHGLLEWFISQQEKTVKGYSRAIYTGFTTQILAELLSTLIENHPDLSGLWHASSQSISKYELLRLVNKTFKLGITIEKDDTFVCDRSLDSSRFHKETGYQPPTWSDMIGQMLNDPTPYDQYKE